MGATLSSHRSLLAVRGVNATIARGSKRVPIRALLGKSEFESQDSDGQIITTSVVDLIVAAEDYRFGSSPSLPRDGDTVKTQGTSYMTRVPGGSKVYDWLGHDKEVFRVHLIEAG